jgi:hypothetical protein
VHSDGDWDIPALLAEARAAGLDFVALTDHNTTSPLAAIGGLSDPQLLVIPGVELTTFHGHALSLGTREWIDWGVLREDPGMSSAAEEVRRLGGLFVIAHPRADGDPACTGCEWRFDGMMPGPAPAVEVWNGPWAGRNEDGLALWYAWLDAGHRVVATAGSDAHAHGGFTGGVGCNVVWSEGCSEEAVLRSIAAGRLYLSAGPALELSAGGGGRLAVMGGTLAAGTAELRLRWENCPADAIVRLMGEGGVLAEQRSGEHGTGRWDGMRTRWCVAELRDRTGSVLAVTNPVHLAAGSARG